MWNFAGHLLYAWEKYSLSRLKALKLAYWSWRTYENCWFWFCQKINKWSNIYPLRNTWIFGPWNHHGIEGRLRKECWLVGIRNFGLLIANWVMHYIYSHPPFYDMKPLGIYQKILKGIIEFPAFLSLRSKDLIRKLLNPEVKYRLGVADV